MLGTKEFCFADFMNFDSASMVLPTATPPSMDQCVEEHCRVSHYKSCTLAVNNVGM